MRMLAVLLCFLTLSACSSSLLAPLRKVFAPRTETEPELGHGLLRERLVRLCEIVEKEKLDKQKISFGDQYYAATPAVRAQIDALLKTK